MQSNIFGKGGRMIDFFFPRSETKCHQPQMVKSFDFLLQVALSMVLI